MTTLLAATFALKVFEEATLPAWSGVLVRDWLMAQLAATAPALHESVQADENRPYTVSAVLGGSKSHYAAGTTASFRVTSLQTDFTQWMQDELLSKQPEIIMLAKQPFAVETVAVTTSTSTELLDTFALQTGHLSRRITIHFDSPTTFRRHGLSFALPLPDWVFGHWLDKWNRFNPQKLHPDGRRYAAECITVGRHNLRSRYWSFDGTNYGPISGTVGFVQFNMVKGDRYWQSIMHALAAYGTWAGAGTRTAVGMGQNRIETHFVRTT